MSAQPESPLTSDVFSSDFPSVDPFLQNPASCHPFSLVLVLQSWAQSLSPTANPIARVTLPVVIGLHHVCLSVLTSVMNTFFLNRNLGHFIIPHTIPIISPRLWKKAIEPSSLYWRRVFWPRFREATETLFFYNIGSKSRICCLFFLTIIYSLWPLEQ